MYIEVGHLFDYLEYSCSVTVSIAYFATIDSFMRRIAKDIFVFHNCSASCREACVGKSCIFVPVLKRVQ